MILRQPCNLILDIGPPYPDRNEGNCPDGLYLGISIGKDGFDWSSFDGMY